MNRLEEIQEIIKDFIYEKQQMKQEIAEIENERTQLAAVRNEKKSNMKKYNAYTEEVEAEVNALGKEISDLGNQSQELQNKLDSKYIKTRNEVNMQIDNLISEEIRKIRKITELKEEIEEKVNNQENRNARYEVQKQEFLTRFGRTPELSEKAQKENEIQEKENSANKQKIAEIDEQINKAQEELSELVRNKKEFKNGNYSYIIGSENEIDVQPTEIAVEFEEDIVEEQEEIETIIENAEDISKENLAEIVNLVEDIIEEQKLDEEQNKVISEDVEEESIILPFIEENTKQIEEETEIQEDKTQIIEEDNENQKVSIEEFEPIEEIKIEDIEPITEVSIEEFEPIEEIQVEEFKPISEINVEDFVDIPEVKVEEIQVEEFEPIPEIKVEEFEPDKINEGVKTIETNCDENKVNVEKIVENTVNNEDVVENIKESEEEEIILADEEEQKETKETLTFGQKVTLLNITAKIENDEVVYIGQISNGKIIKIYPAKFDEENLILKDKENREELKEILINYAIAEYRTLDKKVIKKIDPIVCEILVRFAKEYNYDTQNLIYNYAMSFSRNEEIELEAIPQIIYNFSYIESTKLSKKEKEILLKICKNARKNEKIEIIGYNTGIKKIKYIFKRTFNLNDANALPEGKY